MAAGLVDSFCLSMAWTVVVLEVTRRHGLLAAGLCSTAMLVGVALSAPIATWMAHHLDGRRLLRVAGLIEAAMRISVFVLLATGASVWLIALCITAMNVVAWTGYAGMRAEVAAVTDGAGGLTWYGTIVAAVEAIGIAAGAMLPTGASGRPSDTVLVVVTRRLCGCARPDPGGCGRLAGPARRTNLAPCRHAREAERCDGARRPAHAGRLGTDAARRSPGRGAARPCRRGPRRDRLHPRFAARPGRRDLPGAARAATSPAGGCSWRSAWWRAGCSHRCRSRGCAWPRCCPACA